MSDFMVGKYLIFISFANVHEFPFTKINDRIMNQFSIILKSLIKNSRTCGGESLP